METKNQQLQENQYIFPYHYNMKKDSYSGLVYFSYIEKCIEIIHSFQGKKILDAGCGDGYFIKRIMSSKNEIYGTDYSQKAIDLAKVMSGCQNFICDDVTTLEKIPDESFDVITNIAVIEHIKPELVDKTISIFRRVLKKEGLLIMVIPTPNLNFTPKHFQHFSIDRIKKMISNFQIEKLYGLNKPAPVFRFFTKLFNNPVVFSAWIFHHILEPIYSKFIKNCSPEEAGLVIVIAKK